MKKIKLKLVYWLMKTMNIRFVAIEMDDNTEELSIHGNIPITDFEMIMGVIKEIKNNKNEQR